MILRNATIQYSGTDPDTLTPKSHKRICCACDRCGRVRWIPKQGYRDLCYYCSISSQETKQKMIDNHTDFNGDKNPFYGHKHSDETKKFISCSHQGIKMESFNGFLTDKPYCEKWTEELRQLIRDKYHNKCFLCDKTKKDNLNHNLSVHHVNRDKMQGCNSGWELIPLCMKCHRIVHNKLWEYRLKYLIK